MLQGRDIHCCIPRSDTAREWQGSPEVKSLNKYLSTEILPNTTYDVSPPFHSGLISISPPVSSLALENLKTASKQTIADHKEASARWRPGHIRRPNPHTTLTVSSVRVPSGFKKRSGLKSNAFGYFFSSWHIPLRRIQFRNPKQEKIIIPNIRGDRSTWVRHQHEFKQMTRNSEHTFGYIITFVNVAFDRRMYDCYD